MAKIITPGYQYDVTYVPLENMTDEEFYNFCLQNRKVPIERDENHQILFMPPSDSVYDHRNADIITDLANWNRRYKPGIHFGSSAGFYLPDGSMRSPDPPGLAMSDGMPYPQKNKLGLPTSPPTLSQSLPLHQIALHS